jgi:hypothetical protein
MLRQREYADERRVRAYLDVATRALTLNAQ